MSSATEADKIQAGHGGEITKAKMAWIAKAAAMDGLLLGKFRRPNDSPLNRWFCE
jgi:hypothetical protein